MKLLSDRSILDSDHVNCIVIMISTYGCILASQSFVWYEHLFIDCISRSVQVKRRTVSFQLHELSREVKPTNLVCDHGALQTYPNWISICIQVLFIASFVEMLLRFQFLLS